MGIAHPTFQFVEKPLFRRIRPSVGGGARGGGSPPRVESNALNALHGKAFSERSEDFFDSLGGGAVRRLFSFFRKSKPALPKNSRKPARVIVNKS